MGILNLLIRLRRSLRIFNLSQCRIKLVDGILSSLKGRKTSVELQHELIMKIR